MLPNNSHHPEIEILNSNDFHDTDALRQAASNSLRPVLLIVDQTELTDVLCWLAEKDDVCLNDSPTDLIEYRLESLAREIEGLRDPLTGLLNRQRFEQLLNEATTDCLLYTSDAADE